MKIIANKRFYLKQIGIVCSKGNTNGYVVGEWGITTIAGSPKDAILYSLSHADTWEIIRAGNGRAKYWKKRYVSYQIDGRNIKSTKDIFTDCDPLEALEHLRNWRDWAWENNAVISSFTSTANSLWRGTLSGRSQIMVASGRLPVPVDKLFLGGRQEVNRGVFDHASLWDISGAYPAAMGEIAVGARYRRVSRDSHKAILSELNSVGFAHARVSVKKNQWGPLPQRVKHGVTFPKSGMVEGIYDFSELRAADAIGLNIYIQEAWLARGLRFPWKRWTKIVAEGRKLPDLASRIVKASSNSLWGSFAISGEGKWVRYENERMILEATPPAYKRKNSEVLSAHIASYMRARLFLEGLHFNGESALSCHTDGVIYLPGGKPLNEREPKSLGSWQKRKTFSDLVLVSPTVYAYRNDTGERRYNIPGAPLEFRQSIFRQLTARFDNSKSKLITEGGF